MGILLGGHWFHVEKERLVPSLIACVLTGVALGLLETGGSTVWLHQGRGLMTMAKLGLLCGVPFCWDCWNLRVALLMAIVVLASVGSHMSARFRYYSILRHEIVPSHNGPGSADIEEDGDETTQPGDNG